MKGLCLMLNKRIAKYTQLFNEGILLYFLLVPIFLRADGNLPFFSYIILIVIMLIIHGFLLHVTSSYIVFVIEFFILLIGSYLILQYPWAVSLVQSIYMIWRFKEHEKSADLQNQMTVLLIFSVLFLMNIIFYFDEKIIGMAITLLVSVLLGYFASRIYYHDLTTIKQIIYNLAAVFGLILVGSIIIYLSFGLIKLLVSFLWTVFNVMIVFGAGLIGKLVDFIGIDFEGIQNWVESEYGNMEIEQLEEQTQPPAIIESEVQRGSESGIRFWLWGVGAFVIFVLSMLLSKKKRGQDFSKEQAPLIGSYFSKEKKTDRKIIEDRFSLSRTNHQIRKQVLKFEYWAYKNGVGRKPSETIEEWFQRLNLDQTNLELYQMVRYGEFETLTDEEIHEFRSILKTMVETLKKDLSSS